MTYFDGIKESFDETDEFNPTKYEKDFLEDFKKAASIVNRPIAEKIINSRSRDSGGLKASSTLDVATIVDSDESAEEGEIENELSKDEQIERLLKTLNSKSEFSEIGHLNRKSYLRPKTPSDQLQPLTYWPSKVDKYPVLAFMASIYLAMQGIFSFLILSFFFVGSSAASERSFSQMNSTVGNDRARMGTEMVHATQIIKSHLREEMLDLEAQRAVILKRNIAAFRAKTQEKLSRNNLRKFAKEVLENDNFLVYYFFFFKTFRIHC